MTESARIERVLAIGAHPDDCELLCGGTLTLFARGGARTTLCAVTRGDKGSRSVATDELTGIRMTEATRAAAVIGAEAVCLGLADGEIGQSLEQRLRLLEVIRLTRPDLILTHSPDDYHADHQATSKLVTECSWFAASPGYKTNSPAAAEPVPVYYFDTLAGLDFEPTEYVDITEVWLQKEQMLRCHASQLGPTAQHGDRDLIALAHDVARVRGHQCSVQFAEGFRPCLKWKRIRPRRLLP